MSLDVGYVCLGFRNPDLQESDGENKDIAERDCAWALGPPLIRLKGSGPRQHSHLRAPVLSWL